MCDALLALTGKGIALRRTELKGRHVVASAPLQAGALLLRHAAYSAAADEGVCDVCFKRSSACALCSRCRCVRYCGGRCQRGAAHRPPAQCAAFVACALTDERCCSLRACFAAIVRRGRRCPRRRAVRRRLGVLRT